MLEISACAPPSARYDRRVRHSGVETKRSWKARTTTVCAVALAAVCALSPSASATTIPPGRIVSLIPSDDEVSQFVGLPVTQTGSQGVRPRPSVHLDQRDECRPLLFAVTDDVWGKDYTAFRSQIWSYQPDPSRMFATAAVGTFTNTGSARDRFDSIYNPNLFSMCNHAEFRSVEQDAGIMFELYDYKVNDDVIIWTLAAKYYGQYNGYNNVFVAWHVGNVMAISSAGQQGNPSEAVKRLTGHILDRVG
jgi:PknH-like extracellular domain